MRFLPARRSKTRAPMQPPKSEGPIRCASYLQWVRGHNCVCAETDPTGCEGKIQAAHVRRGTDGGIGMKPSDCYSLPLCSSHHGEQHRIGEQSFEKKYRFSMRQVADRLWKRWTTTTEAGRKFMAARESATPIGANTHDD